MFTSTPFTSSRDIYAWLSGFINLERGQSIRSFNLDRMVALASLAANPEKCAPSIHVAGSKGKGSVTGMIAAILEEAGIKTARYASPHVSDFRERLTMGKSFFDEQVYTAAGNELRELIDFHSVKFDDSGFEEPTFFELITLWFFLCARQGRCGAMSVETGMGGKLDATNILEPLLSVITIIELEHTEYLGETIAAIAAEKAGIIKHKRPLILAEQSDEALKVFKEYAARMESPLLNLNDHTELRNVQVDRDGTSFTLVLKNQAGGEETLFRELVLSTPGEVQAKNAALAVLAVKTAYPEIQESAIREGLALFKLPARFERVCTSPLVIIDGAHTGRSVDLALKTFCSLYGEGGILIFGCAEGKDIYSMAKLCVSCFSQIIITRPGIFKESKPEEIHSAFVKEADGFLDPPKIFFLPDTDEAVDMAMRMATEQKLPILGTGSFYLAAEIRKRFPA